MDYSMKDRNLYGNGAFSTSRVDEKTHLWVVA